MKLIDQIKSLVETGVLGSEYPPEEKYWSWPIQKPELLPENLQSYKESGVVRWYGGEEV